MSKEYIHANFVKICQPVHEISHTQALFGLNLAVRVPRPWKLDQGHQNLISSSSCPNVISMQIWSKSANWFTRYCAHKKLSRWRQQDPHQKQYVPLTSRGEYRLAKPYRDILRYGDSVLRYVLNMYWIASKGIEMDFWVTFIPVQQHQKLWTTARNPYNVIIAWSLTNYTCINP